MLHTNFCDTSDVSRPQITPRSTAPLVCEVCAHLERRIGRLERAAEFFARAEDTQAQRAAHEEIFNLQMSLQIHQARQHVQGVNNVPEQETGFAAERWVFEQLSEQGYQPRWPSRWTAPNCDIKVGKLPVEVKVANPTDRNYYQNGVFMRTYTRWQWHIHPTAQQMQGEWALVLVAIYQGQKWPFIVPGHAVNERPHIQLTSAPPVYGGWLAPYLNRWEVIKYLADGVYRQGGPLFWQWLTQGQQVAVNG